MKAKIVKKSKKADSLGALPSYKLEALRYVENAQKLLSENGKKKGEFYEDKKYVRMAGNTLWNGILEAIKGYLGNKGIKWNKTNRVSKDWYEEQLAKENKELLKLFTSAYNICHLYMGYDGELKYTISQDGISLAQRIIDKA